MRKDVKRDDESERLTGVNYKTLSAGTGFTGNAEISAMVKIQHTASKVKRKGRKSPRNWRLLSQSPELSRREKPEKRA